MAERLVSGGVQPEDADLSLRPRRLDDFVGQTQTKENLKIAIQAAKLRDESLDHAIIYGPPGLGKTTLANIIAAEMDVAIRVTSGPAVERIANSPMTEVVTTDSIRDHVQEGEQGSGGRICRYAFLAVDHDIAKPPGRLGEAAGDVRLVRWCVGAGHAVKGGPCRSRV